MLSLGSTFFWLSLISWYICIKFLCKLLWWDTSVTNSCLPDTDIPHTFLIECTLWLLDIEILQDSSTHCLFNPMATCTSCLFDPYVPHVYLTCMYLLSIWHTYLMSNWLITMYLMSIWHTYLMSNWLSIMYLMSN